MKPYIVDETRITGEIKKQFTEFVKNSQTIDQNSKDALLKELGSNWFDQRFNPRAFIRDAMEFSVMEWKRQQFETVELWKQIAINASINNTAPHEIADKAVKEFEKQYVNIDKKQPKEIEEPAKPNQVVYIVTVIVNNKVQVLGVYNNYIPAQKRAVNGISHLWKLTPQIHREVVNKINP